MGEVQRFFSTVRLRLVLISCHFFLLHGASDCISLRTGFSPFVVRHSLFVFRRSFIRPWWFFSIFAAAAVGLGPRPYGGRRAGAGSVIGTRPTTAAAKITTIFFNKGRCIKTPDAQKQIVVEEIADESSRQRIRGRNKRGQKIAESILGQTFLDEKLAHEKSGSRKVHVRTSTQSVAPLCKMMFCAYNPAGNLTSPSHVAKNGRNRLKRSIFFEKLRKRPNASESFRAFPNPSERAPAYPSASRHVRTHPKTNVRNCSRKRKALTKSS